MMLLFLSTLTGVLCYIIELNLDFLGVSTPPLSKSGKPLPGSRAVSLVIYPDVQLEDPKWTLNAMQYGQIITHDMSMIAGSTQARK